MWCTCLCMPSTDPDQALARLHYSLAVRHVEEALRVLRSTPQASLIEQHLIDALTYLEDAYPALCVVPQGGGSDESEPF